jgi:hypothetical protein
MLPSAKYLSGMVVISLYACLAASSVIIIWSAHLSQAVSSFFFFICVDIMCHFVYLYCIVLLSIVVYWCKGVAVGEAFCAHISGSSDSGLARGPPIEIIKLVKGLHTVYSIY